MNNPKDYLFPNIIRQEETEPDPEYEEFKSEFRKKAGIILNLYKEKQMKRRINTLIQRKGLNTYQEFLSLLDSSPFEMTSFLDYITINVTEFNRTPEHWKDFEETVLKKLISSDRTKIRIWSCASSTGEEPYSIAMSLVMMGADLSRFEIIASDIDETVLSKAKKAFYPESSLRNLSEETRDRFFTRRGKEYHLSKEITSAVKFRKLDLLQDEFPQELDLILCRNILIYFTENAKEKIYNQFRESLIPGGYLFTGNAEQIIYYRRYGMEKITGYLYRKQEHAESSGEHSNAERYL